VGKLEKMIYHDYYEVLGIPFNSTKDEIRKAYKALAKKFHPDVSGYDSSKTFSRIIEAYAVLSDPSKKSVYDTFYHAGTFSNLTLFCGECLGSGLQENKCYICGGEGAFLKKVKYGKSNVPSKIICTLCQGSGIIKIVCYGCT
jgi:DnaJ-class molecular chaperone